MRNFFSLLSLILLAAISACSHEPDPRIDSIYYTKYTLSHEKGHYLSTNYHKGVLLPVNSKVMIKKINKEVIQTEIIASGESLTIINGRKQSRKYTKERTGDIFAKTFSKTPVDLSRFTDFEKRNIAAGKVEKGMSKEAVIVAYGYPPKVETPSLDSNEWLYWISKFDRLRITFENNKVSSIKN